MKWIKLMCWSKLKCWWQIFCSDSELSFSRYLNTSARLYVLISFCFVTAIGYETDRKILSEYRDYSSFKAACCIIQRLFWGAKHQSNGSVGWSIASNIHSQRVLMHSTWYISKSFLRHCCPRTVWRFILKFILNRLFACFMSWVSCVLWKWKCLLNVCGGIIK